MPKCCDSCETGIIYNCIHRCDHSHALYKVSAEDDSIFKVPNEVVKDLVNKGTVLDYSHCKTLHAINPFRPVDERNVNVLMEGMGMSQVWAAKGIKSHILSC